MASSSRSNNDSILVEKMSGLNLDDSDIELDYHGDEDVAGPEEKIANPLWCVVGRVVTDKFVTPNSLSDAMGKAWRPGEGMTVKELGNNNPVLLRPLNPDQNPRQVELTSLDIWVQIHDLVGGLRYERVLRGIGNTIGIFKYNDTNNQDMLWKYYMRIRVIINIQKPLKR
ncbi:hypothetical protein KY290_017227 [Solanum tuberosum]|uniref:DUF4283 domain-containing protein n=1 Tax=Solanum tuberosum TaxID=4113 RepID=A0ABQ7VC95_SOLTU|nr:hypothetical protein KY285_016262 [Solanum tuberosum]KAH0761154.1 hypothetical protein KY290_017227 [Solanum tuberosum]